MGKEGNVISVFTKADFDEQLALSKDNLVVVHFWAEWAPQCQQIKDVLLELSKNRELGNIRYVMAEAERLEEISKKYGVSSVPTCIMFVDSKVVVVVDGADVPVLTKKIKELAFKYFPFSVSSIPTSQAEKTDINERLKQLINKAPVMIFMKGNPDQPRCGFSRQLMDIVKPTNVEFETFDILTDEEVRQGLKTYSNWPTYPQVYVNGSLVGGLDIIKELVAAGELDQTLRGE